MDEPRSEGWEGEPPRRRSWTGVLVVLVLVVLGALLVRPGTNEGPSGDLEVLPGRDDEATEASPGPEPTGPPEVAVLHALNTADLSPRRPPLELPLDGRTLHSAMSTRGRQLVVLAFEHPGGQMAELEVRNASTLERVADLGRRAVRGPMEHVGISADGEAVVWVDPPRDPGEGPVVQRLGIRGGGSHRLQLPEGFAVRDVRAPRGEAVVVLGTRRGEGEGDGDGDGEGEGDGDGDGEGDGEGEPLVLLRASGLDRTDRNAVELTELELGDVGEGAGPGATAGGPVRPRAGHAWDDRLRVLHVVHAEREAVTSVHLVSGHMTTVAGEGDLAGAGVVRREARLTLDGAAVVASATLTRPDPRRGIGRDVTVPLEPLVFAVDPFAEEASLDARGEADGEAVLTAGVDRVAFTAPAAARAPAEPASLVRLRDLDLAPVGEPLLLDGTVTDGALDHAQTHLLLVRESARGTLLSGHPVGDGGRDDRVERRFGSDATVHLQGVVVVELRAGRADPAAWTRPPGTPSADELAQPGLGRRGDRARAAHRPQGAHPPTLLGEEVAGRR